MCVFRRKLSELWNNDDHLDYTERRIKNDNVTLKTKSPNKTLL